MNKKIIKSDLKRLDAMRDEDIDYSDIPELDEDFWKDAKLVIQNGTTQADLDSQTALYLKNQGFNIVQFSPADANTYAQTVIVVYNEDKNYTLQLLKLLFNIEEENIRRSSGSRFSRWFSRAMASKATP